MKFHNSIQNFNTCTVNFLYYCTLLLRSENRSLNRFMAHRFCPGIIWDSRISRQTACYDHSAYQYEWVPSSHQKGQSKHRQHTLSSLLLSQNPLNNHLICPNNCVIVAWGHSLSLTVDSGWESIPRQVPQKGEAKIVYVRGLSFQLVPYCYWAVVAPLRPTPLADRIGGHPLLAMHYPDTLRIVPQSTLEQERSIPNSGNLPALLVNHDGTLGRKETATKHRTMAHKIACFFFVYYYSLSNCYYFTLEMLLA